MKLRKLTKILSAIEDDPLYTPNYNMAISAVESLSRDKADQNYIPLRPNKVMDFPVASGVFNKNIVRDML
jgi:hypothetical protein